MFSLIQNEVGENTSVFLRLCMMTIFFFTYSIVCTEEYGGPLFYKFMNIRGCNPNQYNYVERLHFYQVDMTTLYI